MRRFTGLVAFGLACAAMGCERSWDFEGKVVTESVHDRDRGLYVYFLSQPKLDPGALPKEPLTYLPLAVAERIPDKELPFTHSEFGCHAGSVMVVAWAPKTRPSPSAPRVNPKQPDFLPTTGDYVAVSDVHHPFCGSRKDSEHIEVVLTESPR
jgi:hypothetical protein